MCVTKSRYAVILVDAHPRCPTSLFVFYVNLVGKRIAPLGCDGGDVIFVGVGKSDDLHDGGEECLFHSAPDLCSLYSKLGKRKSACVFLLVGGEQFQRESFAKNENTHRSPFSARQQ